MLYYSAPRWWTPLRGKNSLYKWRPWSERWLVKVDIKHSTVPATAYCALFVSRSASSCFGISQYADSCYGILHFCVLSASSCFGISQLAGSCFGILHNVGFMFCEFLLWHIAVCRFLLRHTALFWLVCEFLLRHIAVCRFLLRHTALHCFLDSASSCFGISQSAGSSYCIQHFVFCVQVPASAYLSVQVPALAYCTWILNHIRLPVLF